MTVLLCSVFSILRYKEHKPYFYRNILYLTWTRSSNPQLFRTGLLSLYLSFPLPLLSLCIFFSLPLLSLYLSFPLPFLSLYLSFPFPLLSLCLSFSLPLLSLVIYIHYIIQSQYTIIYTRETLGNLKIKTKIFDFEERVLIGWLAQSIVLIGWR